MYLTKYKNPVLLILDLYGICLLKQIKIVLNVDVRHSRSFWDRVDYDHLVILLVITKFPKGN
jgi:hypothetical protein